MLLSSASVGVTYLVASLDAASPHEQRKLMALGMVPGTELQVIQIRPAFVVALGYTQLALDRETAALVEVTGVPRQ